MLCTNCGSDKHTTKNCPKTKDGAINRERLHCTICMRRDHNKNACPHSVTGNTTRIQHPETIEDDFVKDY